MGDLCTHMRNKTTIKYQIPVHLMKLANTAVNCLLKLLY